MEDKNKFANIVKKILTVTATILRYIHTDSFKKLQVSLKKTADVIEKRMNLRIYLVELQRSMRHEKNKIFK